MLIGAAAPVAFISVVIAQREQLDVELATAAASLSALVGIVLLPLALLALT
jgi:predicted permease